MNGSAKPRPKDYKSDLKPIWCPGCGHYSVLNAITKALASLGLDKDNTVMVSGIGCSYRPMSTAMAFTGCTVAGWPSPRASKWRVRS